MALHASTRRWLMRLALLAVIAFPVLLILRWGGKGAWTLQLGGGVAAVGALAVVLALPARLRLPPWGWLLALLVPLLAVTGFQALPLGLLHPYAAADAAALGVTGRTWALDGDAAVESVAWSLALLCWGLSALAVLRRIPPARIAGWLVIAAAAHALAAMLLATIAPAFPYDNGYAGRVRGSFTYPNHAAAFWLMSLPLALLWARRLACAGKPQAWLAPAALLVAIVLSASRGGTILALLIGLPLLWTVLPQRRRSAWALAVLGVALAGLWLMNLDEAAGRFAALDGDQGATLSGRLVLWRAALPLALGVGVIGLGPDAARLAWRRSGEGSFEPSNVHELHNDLLEVLLTHGWLGLLAVIAGGAYAARQLWHGRGRRHAWVMLGAAGGMLALGLYALVDFPWQSEGLVVWWFGLALLAALAHCHRTRRRVAAWRFRLCCALAVVALALLAPLDWRQERESVQAWWAERMAAERRAAGSVLRSAEAVATALDAEPRGARLAVVQARLALDLAAEEPALIARAERALAIAARASPANGQAWVERLRLARLRADSAAAAQAQVQAARWAPAWPYAQHQALQAWQHGLIEAEQAQAVAGRILSQDQARPGWVFPVLEDILGRRELALALADAATPARLRGSAMPWLGSAAGLDLWQAAWRLWFESKPGVHLKPEQWSAVSALVGDPGLPTERLRLPSGDQAKRVVVQRLRRAGLAIPTPLSAALAGREPAALALLDPAPDDPAAVASAISALSEWTAQTWIESQRGELGALHLALEGDAARLNAQTPPDHLVAAHDRSQDPSQRRHLSELLARHRQTRWQDLPDGAWTWWLLDVRTGPQVVELSAWTALVVDGGFTSWLRGSIDLRAHVPRGLHRVALITPPQ